MNKNFERKYSVHIIKPQKLRIEYFVLPPQMKSHIKLFTGAWHETDLQQLTVVFTFHGKRSIVIDQFVAISSVNETDSPIMSVVIEQEFLLGHDITASSYARSRIKTDLLFPNHRIICILRGLGTFDVLDNDIR